MTVFLRLSVFTAVKFGRMSKKQREKVEDEVRFHRERLTVRPQGPPGSVASSVGTGPALASSTTTSLSNHGPSSATSITTMGDPSPDSSVYDPQQQQPSSSQPTLPYVGATDAYNPPSIPPYDASNGYFLTTYDVARSTTDFVHSTTTYDQVPGGPISTTGPIATVTPADITRDDLLSYSVDPGNLVNEMIRMVGEGYSKACLHSNEAVCLQQQQQPPPDITSQVYSIRQMVTGYAIDSASSLDLLPCFFFSSSFYHRRAVRRLGLSVQSA